MVFSSILRWMTFVLSVMIFSVHAADIEQIQQAYAAFQKKQPDILSTFEQSMSDSLLHAYPAFWRLQLAMAQTPVTKDSVLSADVLSFIRKNTNTYLGNRMLSDWIKQFAETKDFSVINTYYPQVIHPDTQLTCYAWQAALSEGNTAFLQEAKTLWSQQIRVPLSCQNVFGTLVQKSAIAPLHAIERIHVLWSRNRPADAKILAINLPFPDTLSAETYERLVKKPTEFLNLTEVVPSTIRLLALLRIAGQNPQQSVQYWQEIDADTVFSDAQKALFWNLVGFEGAQRLLPEASEWFHRAPVGGYYPQLNEVTAWKARAGLRNSDWPLVLMATEEMHALLAATPDWIYWRAKAFHALGRTADAVTLWASIADKPVYYGILAGEEINQPFEIPTTQKAADTVVLEVESLPAMKRALLLFEAGLRREALREWFWAIRDMDDAALLATAEIALRYGLYDRMISAADQTVSDHNYFYRYPMPHRQAVQAAASNEGLSESWVYGLIRQESRFVQAARSSAGASGMMQLMPATAKWTAKRIGLSDFSPSQVNDLYINLKLGCAYLNYVLGRFDHQAPLGFAGYNAGPGRPNRWRAYTVLSGPAYIESIPFSETRDYVKKVIANIYLYEKITKATATPIKTLSGTIGARD